MNLPQSQKIRIKIFRWDAEEIYNENNVLIGYIERQGGETYRKIMLDTYAVTLWGTESRRERRARES